MGRHPSTKAGSVFIVLPGDERLDLVDVRFAHTGQFANLHDPESLQFFRSRFVVHVGYGEAVRVPFAA